MKAVILAGGFGTRLSEETVLRPKPMVEIGGQPILWHILKLYSHFGINEFVICLGYKGFLIKEYFANYFLHQSNVTFDIQKNSMKVHNSETEPWKVTLIDTGYDTMTGARLKMIEKYIDSTFLLTYGDGLADVDIGKLIELHKSHGKIATITSVQPAGRFGVLNINSQNDQVAKFSEKPKGDGNWINAGFFVLEPEFFSYLNNDPQLILEREPFEKLSQDGEMFTYKHSGFWKCMDTARDHKQLEEMWKDNPPWKLWEKTKRIIPVVRRRGSEAEL